MQTVDPATAAVLQSSIRAPRVYAMLQVPVVTDASLLTIDASKLGGQLIINDALELRMVQSLDIGADTVDLKVANQDGAKSPMNPNAPFSRFYFPGSLDNKLSLYLGYSYNVSGESVLPKGVYISENFKQDAAAGQNTATINGLDQFSMFQGSVYTQFPPRLWGNQQYGYFNPNYALQNPSGDLKTYVCDAVMWMQNPSDSPLWKSDYTAVNVYVSTYSSGTTPVPNSGSTAYTVDYNKGVVTFSTAQAAGTVVSVDARPLAMAPELMLKHLFVDFGSFDPNFLKFDSTGMYLPIMELARDRAIIEVAKEIVLCTAPRGIRWRLYFDEDGYLIFTEGALDGPPVKILVDEKDILHVQPEYGSAQIKNVVKATARSAADQNLTAISYDVHSIAVFGQKPTYTVPTQMLATVAGMDSGSGINYMNGLCNSAIFELSMPQVTLEVEVLPDFSLQVGDPVGIIETMTGISSTVTPQNSIASSAWRQFFIQQITNELQGTSVKQTLKLTEVRRVQDYMYGINAAVGTPMATNPLAINTQSGMIDILGLQNSTGPEVQVVAGGQPVLDQAMQPLLFAWDGGALNINITLATPPSGAQYYIWRWMYIAEDVFANVGGAATLATGNGHAAQVWGSGIPLATALQNFFGTNGSYSATYDTVANVDSIRSRRYYWPLLRCNDWLSVDGVGAYGATTLSSTWTGGVGATNPQLYGNLRVGLTDAIGNTSSGFVGQELYAPGSVGATNIGNSSTVKYGVDFGLAASQTLYYGIKRKLTPCYLCVLVANTAGGVQFKRVPFYLSI